MKAGGGADEIPALLQGDTSEGLRVFQFVKVGEMVVDHNGVGQRPSDREVLGGLELGRVRRQKQPGHLLWHAQRRAGGPSLPSPLGRARARFACAARPPPAEQRRRAPPRIVSNTSMLTAEARGKTVRPKAGWTTPASHRQASRCGGAAASSRYGVRPSPTARPWPGGRRSPARTSGLTFPLNTKVGSTQLFPSSGSASVRACRQARR
jgi:hypothetical protein